MTWDWNLVWDSNTTCLLYIIEKNKLERTVEILAAPSKLQQHRAIENNATKHKPVNKPANLPLTGLINLEHLNNSRIGD